MPEPDESSSSNANEESSSTDQESSASESSSASSSGSESDAGKELTPEQLKAEITKVRAEAANYRTRLRETERKLADAKTPEEVEAAINELREANTKDVRDLLVENVALKFKLPEKLAARLQGSTREELEADAKELAEFARTASGPDADELNGGLSPRQNRDADPDDPGKLAEKYSSRGRQRARTKRT